MKTQSNILLRAISNTQVSNLTKEVKETIAVDHSAAEKKFTAVDLWSILRKSRSAAVKNHFEVAYLRY